LRKATSKPLVARLIVESWEHDLDRAINGAAEVGLDGCVVVHGEASPLRAQGCLHGPHAQKHVLALIERASRRAGEQFAIIGSCGVLTPDHALAMLDRGARLVQLYEGLIYAGPGLPKRIVQRQLQRSASSSPVVARPASTVAAQSSSAIAGPALALTLGGVLVLLGVVALILAARLR